MAIFYFTMMDTMGFNFYNRGSISILLFWIFYFFILPFLIVRLSKINCIHNIFVQILLY